MKIKFINGEIYKYISKYSPIYKRFLKSEKENRKSSKLSGLPYHPMCFTACGYRPIFDREYFKSLVSDKGYSIENANFSDFKNNENPNTL